MAVEFSELVKIRMDNITTEVRIVIFRSNLNRETIGLKTL